MALRFTLKKKDYADDERTVQAEEFVQRMVSTNRDVERRKHIPQTETKK